MVFLFGRPLRFPGAVLFLVVDVLVCRLCRFFGVVCFKTVEIHSAARRHPCRGANAVSLGPEIPQKTIEILTLQYIDKVTDVVQVLQSSSAVVEETADLPQLRRFAWTLALHMPVVVQRQVPYGR